MGAVVDNLGFGDFEDDAVDGEPGLVSGFEGVEHGSGPGGETLGQEVEVQRAVDAEARSESDGGGASGLIEQVHAEGRDLVEDLPGGFVPHAADEGFPGDDCMGNGVDDGLKGEAEGGVGGRMRFGAHRLPVTAS